MQGLGKLSGVTWVSGYPYRQQESRVEQRLWVDSNFAIPRGPLPKSPPLSEEFMYHLGRLSQSERDLAVCKREDASIVERGNFFCRCPELSGYASSYHKVRRLLQLEPFHFQVHKPVCSFLSLCLGREILIG